MENVHVDLTPFTSVPATSKIGLINEKGEGYITLNRFGAGNMSPPKQEKAFSSNQATTVPESESGTLITAIVNLQVAL